MSDANIDPTTHRIIQTMDGTVSIPRKQNGVPLTEYFRNTDLPNDLERSIVYATPKGPVLSTPDPVPWNEKHNVKARDYATRIKTLIDEKGYYSKTLNMYAEKLASETGVSITDTKAVISQAFEKEYQSAPFNYLQQQRENQGLPVKDVPTPSHGQERDI